MALPSWQYRDPQDICDRLREATRQELARLERERRRKARRIRRLCQRAKERGA